MVKFCGALKITFILEIPGPEDWLCFNVQETYILDHNRRTLGFLKINRRFDQHF